MTYKYDEQNGNLISNKLYHVNDAIASGIHTADIDDQLGFTTTNITTTNNYTYDAIGNLKQDKTEEILEIKWTVSGKIKKIIRTGISTKPDLEYVYDAMGNRIAKILKPDGSSLENGGTDNPTLWTYTYYVRDAQGNIMANYQKSTANSITSFKLIERSIYGSSRLGIDKTTIDLTASITPPIILNHNLGLKNYELSNHLGNVTTVISDRKIPRSVLGTNINFYMPDIVSATDYYPFGMTMQERTFSAGGVAYRFGFNGQEKENEINGTDGGHLAFEYRIHDARLGRFLSVDPLSDEYPWNSCYAFAENRCIDGIDLEGKEYSNATTNNAPGTAGPITPEHAVKSGATPGTPIAAQAMQNVIDAPAKKAQKVQQAMQVNARAKGIPMNSVEEKNGNTHYDLYINGALRAKTTLIPGVSEFVAPVTGITFSTLENGNEFYGPTATDHAYVKVGTDIKIGGNKIGLDARKYFPSISAPNANSIEGDAQYRTLVNVIGLIPHPVAQRVAQFIKIQPDFGINSAGWGRFSPAHIGIRVNFSQDYDIPFLKKFDLPTKGNLDLNVGFRYKF